MRDAPPPHRRVTASFAIAYVATFGGDTLTVEQIRKWCQRGHVRRVGIDPDGYALYNLDEIVATAQRRGLLEP